MLLATTFLLRALDCLDASSDFLDAGSDGLIARSDSLAVRSDCLAPCYDCLVARSDCLDAGSDCPVARSDCLVLPLIPSQWRRWRKEANRISRGSRTSWYTPLTQPPKHCGIWSRTLDLLLLLYYSQA